jgi:4-diphosphocytidyl-2-C-methyl-D-erythritol kinase
MNRILHAVTTHYKYRSYAKINLYLDVLRQREDGFHDLETIFQTVDLFDELSITPADDVLLTSNVDGLSTGEDNLILRAARALQGQFNIAKGAALQLHKNIPVAAGMAGGSGNAAAALVGLNDLWELEADTKTLNALALSIGSDVPYCLHGGTVAATGRGEKMVPLAPVPPVWIVLVHPPYPVSTADIFNHSALEKSGNAVDSGGQSMPFQEAMARLRFGDLSGCLHNALELPAFDLHPELERIKKRLRDAGCFGALMSGSGPTMMGFCGSENRARKVVDSITDYETTVTRPYPQGILRVD